MSGAKCGRLAEKAKQQAALLIEAAPEAPAGYRLGSVGLNARAGSPALFGYRMLTGPFAETQVFG